jgi:phosphoribosylamine--glycine ligase
MPYGRTTHEQVSNSCSGCDVGEDSPCDCRSHPQDQVEPVGSGASSIRAYPNLDKLEAMKILVLGSGAREHAIIKALIRTGSNPQDITCAPGNGGISQEVTTVNLDANNAESVTNWALEANTDLVVIGPEAPLVAGVSDALRAAGIAVFGPSKAAAALEGSKAFAKDVMAAADVPTGMARKCTTLSEVESALEEYGAPYVVKADGLAAGKGVIVTSDKQAALDHAQTFLNQGMEILVEEFLDGEEVSLFFLADGTSVLPLSPAQDFKRAYNFDQGPNTGGMGAYSPLPWLPVGFVQEVQERVALPTVRELARLGTPFVGLLYCGLIVTSKGIRVIEFNARFGDPETQVVLRRLLTPLQNLLHNAATGHLTEVAEPEFSSDVAVTVVLASEGYPVTSAPDREITGIIADTKSVEVAHAATKLVDGNLYATGGRVLSVVSTATDFHEARRAAYEAICGIELEGSHYRTDIALKVDEVENV